MAAQSTSFLLLSIFRLHGCHFSGWGSRVGGLLISETSIIISRSTTVTKRGRDERRNPDALLQIDKGGALSKMHVCFDKKKFRNPLLYQHISGFLLSSSLHRTSAVAEQSHRRLAFARRTWEWYMYDAHLQRTLACG